MAERVQLLLASPSGLVPRCVFSAVGTNLESLSSTPEKEGYKIISEACDLTQECSSNLWSVKSSGTTPRVGGVLRLHGQQNEFLLSSVVSSPKKDLNPSLCLDERVLSRLVLSVQAHICGTYGACIVLTETIRLSHSMPLGPCSALRQSYLQNDGDSWD